MARNSFQALLLLAIPVVTLPMVGSVAARGLGSAKLPGGAESPELHALRARGNTLFRAGQYLAAIRIYQSGAELAQKRHDPRAELRFLNNLGSAEYLSYRYRDALKSYLRARELANSQRDLETLGAAYFNLSSLYEHMGDEEAALESARAGTSLPPEATRKFRAQLLIQMAKLSVRRQDFTGACALLREAIAVAQDQLDVSTEGQAWNELGATLLDLGRLNEAEFALLEGYRLRRIRADVRIHYSYVLLGRLKLLQGDQAGAQFLFGRAIETARGSGPPAMWNGYYERGRALLAESRLPEAYQDLRTALRYLRQWRAEVLPADAFRRSAEVELQEIYSAFIEAAVRRYRETGKLEFAAEALAASEANRAASLRALWAGDDVSRALPPEYGETLAALRRAEVALLKEDSPPASSSAAALRLRLAEMEAQAGLDLPAGRGDEGPSGDALLRNVRTALSRNEVLLAYHIGARGSCIWVLTRDSFQLVPLTPESSLEAMVSRFVGELRANQAGATSTGATLFHAILGAVDARLLDKPVWIIAPDGPLFELPFAALVESGRSGYVVERHAVREIPGIAALLGVPGRTPSGPFVALGDPIYNRADPRRARGGTGGTLAPPGGVIELARLAGSGREVENCARIWRARGQKPLILEGKEASRANLLAAIRNGPPVLHLAVHILFPAQVAGPGMLALSQEAVGQVDLLSASEIASLRSDLGLVVLDGCSSGKGKVLPGTGLMGLTRAWLAAGARAVVVTRWPAADRDAGELFQAFYENLPLAASVDQVSFSQILQRAQNAQLRAGGAAANPSKWASYFCVERSGGAAPGSVTSVPARPYGTL